MGNLATCYDKAITCIWGNNINDIYGKMKNCPFCQSFNTKVTGEYRSDFNTKSVYVFCINCGCRGPSVVGEGQVVNNNDKSEALKLWNKRE